ncbi:iron complex transport system ATP-binding protein [Austwickia chelonae]|uniref:Putative iron-siderophore ABC transporter ATP-binding protein n=1 Tax=Austwickia chelonae NBRC 105200 TaxID=1184607 RepID=K6VQE5_9MICO|nr:ABC transporter ATP-binding protein [Austwickia chelonae]GAB78964.1 putative iron-siderophore ABC transporter ATP-binding protein [Austwickia chelonae NBRC 105200]SEV87424.1 iron complex transport system ATP-binding protein [Austwickia chelonae]
MTSSTAPLRANGAAALEARDLTLAYEGRVVIDGLDVDLLHGQFTAVIGPNACGKSTLLKGLGRVLSPRRGRVLLDGADIHALPTRQVARSLALLPQEQMFPPGITVTDLVARGRFAHQGLLRRWSAADEAAVSEALVLCRLEDLADRAVDELSGGQRQRAWLALVLAQQAPTVLLDEPTTYLDIVHQLEILRLCRTLHRSGTTLVAVLHDLNQAARFATHVIALREGRIMAEGPPEAVFTAESIADIFGLDVQVIPDPTCGAPLIIPVVPE